jgi:hypothetical protein
MLQRARMDKVYWVTSARNILSSDKCLAHAPRMRPEPQVMCAIAVRILPKLEYLDKF